MNEWISEPNKCIGCPIEKEQWLEFRLSHCCDSDEWEIVHKLDEMGRIICHLIWKDTLAKDTTEAEPSTRRGQKAAGPIKYRNAQEGRR
jgi:hypothetical protein